MGDAAIIQEERAILTMFDNKMPELHLPKII